SGGRVLRRLPQAGLRRSPSLAAASDPQPKSRRTRARRAPREPVVRQCGTPSTAGKGRPRVLFLEMKIELPRFGLEEARQLLSFNGQLRLRGGRQRRERGQG